jgi:hypothetical protein
MLLSRPSGAYALQAPICVPATCAVSLTDLPGGREAPAENIHQPSCNIFLRLLLPSTLISPHISRLMQVRRPFACVFKCMTAGPKSIARRCCPLAAFGAVCTGKSPNSTMNSASNTRNQRIKKSRTSDANEQTRWCGGAVFFSRLGR